MSLNQARLNSHATLANKSSLWVIPACAKSDRSDMGKTGIAIVLAEAHLLAIINHLQPRPVPLGQIFAKPLGPSARPTRGGFEIGLMANQSTRAVAPGTLQAMGNQLFRIPSLRTVHGLDLFYLSTPLL